MAYTCHTCGALADAHGDLCKPCNDTASCTFCGTPKADLQHVCRDKLAAMHFTCTACGRVAKEKGHLCNPSPIIG